jgi:hypothetical protein
VGWPRMQRRKVPTSWEALLQLVVGKRGIIVAGSTALQLGIASLPRGAKGTEHSVSIASHTLLHGGKSVTAHDTMTQHTAHTTHSQHSQHSRRES